MFLFIISLAAAGTAGWWFLLKMPGKNIANAAELSRAEIDLRDELIADVRTLGGEIGERNMWRSAQLNTAADFIESSFLRAGLQPRRDTYQVNDLPCDNIEVEIRGASPQIVLIGAHYDSALGAPGAYAYGCGFAPLVAPPRRFAVL